MPAIVSPIRRSTQTFAADVRRIVIVDLRPIILLVSVPFMIQWKRFFRRDPGETPRLFQIIARLASIVPIVFSFPALVTTISSGVANCGLATAIIFTSAIVVPAAILSPVFKVLLDIFRYVTRPDYRRNIHVLLDKAVENIRIES